MIHLDERFSDPWPLAGTFTRERIASSALRGNALGDPHERTAYVYTPPGYDADPARRYPSIYFLHGYLGRVDGLWNWVGFQPSVPQYIDQCFADPSTKPAIVVLVDAWTKIGGSQYLNSAATGRYLDYLADDVVSAIDERYRTIRDRDHRALSGKSSGGYGAMVATILRPDVFGAFASHSGDCGFEQCYLHDVAACARALREHYGGSWERFFDDFFSRPARILNATDPDHVLINIYAMAAAYSPEEDGSVSVPFDTQTLRFRDDIWRRWQQLDPVRMVAKTLDVLQSLRGIWIDAGRNDDYYLDLGAQAISSQLEAAGIVHHFELFDGSHAGVQHRYPLGFRYLAERLGPTSTCAAVN
ncbi:MAG TPA: alpha/beta hydrolase-fold protein [Gaiellaceae bacterium]|nr:alpha/beta hydrolase-fold protein [Gaiellaceae bacterium]